MRIILKSYCLQLFIRVIASAINLYIRAMKVIDDGYTLLELLTALILIAILTLSAMVITRSPTVTMQQATAKLDLLHYAEALEDYHQLRGDYPRNLQKLKYQPASKWHKFSLISSDASHYRLAAAPKEVTQDDYCGTFYLDQDGIEAISGLGPLTDCW